MEIRDGELSFKLNLSQVRDDFQRLQSHRKSTLVHSPSPMYSHHQAPIPSPFGITTRLRAGQRFSDYFHWQDRCRTNKVGGGPSSRHHLPVKKSAHELWEDHKHGRTLQISNGVKRWRTKCPDRWPSKEQVMFESLRTNSSLMSVTQFPAHVAKSLADLVKPRRACDFSAGWGDRLTGFLAAKVPEIILIEPRKSACLAYRKQCEAVQDLCPDTNVKVICGTAQEQMRALPDESLDLVLSSPPYFNVEKYWDSDSPDGTSSGQVFQTCSSNTEYQTVFLEPVARECARCVSDSGLVCINIDDNKSKGIVNCEFLIATMESLGLKLVGTLGLSKHQGGTMSPNHQDGIRVEPIYLWSKEARLDHYKSIFSSLQSVSQAGSAMVGSFGQNKRSKKEPSETER